MHLPLRIKTCICVDGVGDQLKKKKKQVVLLQQSSDDKSPESLY